MHTYVLWRFVLQSAASQLEPRVSDTEISMCWLISMAHVVLLPGLPQCLYVHQHQTRAWAHSSHNDIKWKVRRSGLCDLTLQDLDQWPLKPCKMDCNSPVCYLQFGLCDHANVIHIIATPFPFLATLLTVCIIVSEALGTKPIAPTFASALAWPEDSTAAATACSSRRVLRACSASWKGGANANNNCSISFVQTIVKTLKSSLNHSVLHIFFILKNMQHTLIPRPCLAFHHLQYQTRQGLGTRLPPDILIQSHV